jgi:hypothetical protein
MFACTGKHVVLSALQRWVEHPCITPPAVAQVALVAAAAALASQAGM